MNHKAGAKATLDEKLVTDKATLETVDEMRHTLELYLLQVHTQCDFIFKNFENQHKSREDKEMGLKDAETIVTKEEPPAYREVAEQYDEEKTPEDVSENFAPPEEDEAT